MVYFVRHGETDYNIEQIIQGQLDIPLNQTGIKQAEELAESMKDVHIDVIYCSPLRRTKVTADIINKYHNVKVIYDDRLKEFYGGKFQGFRFKDLSPEQKYAIQFEPHKYDAESTEDFYNRAVEFYKEVEHSDKTVLIVSHGGVWRHIHRYKNNLDMSFDLKPPPNSKLIKL